MAYLSVQGASWVKIAEQLGVGEGAVHRAAKASAKNTCPFGSARVPPESQATKVALLRQ